MLAGEAPACNPRVEDPDGAAGQEGEERAREPGQVQPNTDRRKDSRDNDSKGVPQVDRGNDYCPQPSWNDGSPVGRQSDGPSPTTLGKCKEPAEVTFLPACNEASQQQQGIVRDEASKGDNGGEETVPGTILVSLLSCTHLGLWGQSAPCLVINRGSLCC